MKSKLDIAVKIFDGFGQFNLEILLALSPIRLFTISLCFDSKATQVLSSSAFPSRELQSSACIVCGGDDVEIREIIPAFSGSALGQGMGERRGLKDERFIPALKDERWGF
ncbi:MAG: hypothetical protein LHW64_06435 [Candidatus Cloacimonetes bacterium]|jgi:hypothetical protein|nr:hypothetical protein [Candidatus Cloacimonadota bacterium]MCB5287421.1 hypothetical protein [Candidatus Cloacimonadota bacterium]MCK9184207.1 hypothetical protein [Candidatus Cloacimonadota bacterium]MCK9583659.1 hypothetical protein [Candidatus Cloacimonadota bacterium]MDY0229742.1 hypothetical protein [Candidatus Cloacimonadaceae bacterium]